MYVLTLPNRHPYWAHRSCAARGAFKYSLICPCESHDLTARAGGAAGFLVQHALSTCFAFLFFFLLNNQDHQIATSIASWTRTPVPLPRY